MIAKDFVDLKDVSADELADILSVAQHLKALQKSGKPDVTLTGKSLGMIFEKPSLRTRVSFEVGMSQLGGRSLYLSREEVGLGQREAVSDVAQVLSRYVDGIMIRTFSHTIVEELAAHATVPVINGLSDASHPCQALADLLTIQEHLGTVAGKTVNDLLVMVIMLPFRGCSGLCFSWCGQ